MIVLIHNDMELWDFMTEGLKSRDDFYDIPLNRYCSKLHRFFRKFCYNYHLPSWLVFDKEHRCILKGLKPGDKVVVSDYTKLCIFYAIRDLLCPGVELVLWLWNPIKDNDCLIKKISFLELLGVKCCTFDREDARLWNLKYLNTFYNMGRKDLTSKDNKFEYDFYFLGVIKDRGDLIAELQTQLSSFKCLFVVPTQQEHYITYADNIKNIKLSRCIIDIVQFNQYDITLRPLESLACKRKLITNNIHIKEYPFYSPNNIFIWGDDEINKLNIFLDSPFQDVDKEILEKYDINYWLDHI